MTDGEIVRPEPEPFDDDFGPDDYESDDFGPALDSDTEAPPLSLSRREESCDPAEAVDSAPLDRFPLTDLGNAERLVALYGRDLAYCFAWHRWLVWSGRHWQLDETGEAVRRAKNAVRELVGLAAKIDDDKRRKTLLGHAIRSEAEARIRAALALASSEPGVPVIPEDLDRDHFLFACENGTIELETGELRSHDRADRITKLSPVTYDPEATCPLWLSFLDRVFASDQALVDFLKRAVGYSLTGDTSAQVLFLLWGSGANGKTTAIETLRALLGDYGQQTPAETFLERRDSIPNDVARLRGARLAAAVETPESRRLNETMVKRMTGGDTMAARFMRGEWFEFRPLFKVWLATNHLPIVRGTDEAIWRRIRLIPFTVTIPEDERDLRMVDKLRAELPGILNWALEGCLEWQEVGLDEPDAVRLATASYRDEMDTLGQFIADKCVVNEEAWAKASELYTLYGYWAQAVGERDQLSQQAFGRRLAARGFTTKRLTGGVRAWQGIGIAHEAEE
jgi:putative DNA primase/helicase